MIMNQNNYCFIFFSYLIFSGGSRCCGRGGNGMVLGLVLGAVKEVVQGLVQGVVEDVLLEFDTNIGTWEGNRGVQGMVQWLVLCMVAMWGDIRFGMTGATLLATRSVRGAINFFSRCLDFVSTGDLTPIPTFV